jgi:hypothetical protein
MLNFGFLRPAPKATAPIRIDLASISEPNLAFVPVGATVRMLELLNANEVGRLSGHYGTVYSCCANPFREVRLQHQIGWHLIFLNRYLTGVTLLQEMYTGSDDREILIWSFSPKVK